MDKTLTVFTPTYNRAYCIENLYYSLCAQTCRDFVWLVVDDGSTDDTEEKIRTLAESSDFDIKYVKKENGGKHTALMLGIELTETELFLCVDSDDTLTNDAVSIIVKNNEVYREKPILGFYYRQILKDGSLNASKYPAGIEYVGITDLYGKYKFKGDTAIVLKTDLIKPYKFPTFAGEKFVSERAFYCRINHLGKMVLREEKIYIAEYLEDGYTKNSNNLVCKNPYARALGCLDEVTYSFRFPYKVKQYAQYRGIVKVFNLNENILNVYNTSNIFHRIFSLPFVSHYVKLYGKIKVDYEKSLKTD